MAYDYGSSLTSGVTTKTTFDFTDGVYTLTKEIQGNWSNRDSFTPSIGTTLSTGGKTYKLTRATQETLPGSLVKVVLTYTAEGSSSEDLPATTYSEQTSQLEVDIREHPNFSEWEDDWDDEKGEFKAGTEKYGIRSYFVGTTQVVKTQYFSSKPSAPYGSIGTLESPGGDYGSSENWLLVGAGRSNFGNIWMLEKTYLYSAKPWNTDIYD